jgi:hypothetical protein
MIDRCRRMQVNPSRPVDDQPKKYCFPTKLRLTGMEGLWGSRFPDDYGLDGFMASRAMGGSSPGFFRLRIMGNQK